MKTLTEAQRALAIQYFEYYPAQHILHITSDGQVFLDANKNDAGCHQRSIAPAEPLLTISRADLGAYAPAFDYDSLSPEEKEVFDAELLKAQQEKEAEGDEDDDLIPEGEGEEGDEDLILEGKGGEDELGSEQTPKEEEPAKEKPAKATKPKKDTKKKSNK